MSLQAQLTFYVNGRKVTEVDPCPRTLLADYLRYNLKLRGTKVSCGEGGCGSCTVMVSRFDRSNGKISHLAVNACILPICSLHGLAITTVEAVGSTRSKLHQIQERLVAGHGIQCGYCTPGMVMSMYALLRSNPIPTELQIEHALKGNLCRCTGYRPILDSLRTFATVSECPMGDQCCKNNPEIASSIEKNSSDVVTSELIFPNELQLSDIYDRDSIKFASNAVIWYRPVTLQELLSLKKKYPQALISAGGTNAVFQVKNASPEKPLVVIAITQIQELRCVNEKEDGIWIGAMTSMSDLENLLASILTTLSETKARLASALIDILRVFGSPQIRHRATIGGSLASASSVADVNVLLLVTKSCARVASADGEREVPIDENFFTGKSKTCLKPEEVIVAVFLPYSSKGEYFQSFKQSVRRDFALADVNAGMYVQFKEGGNLVKNIQLVFGGLSEVPLFAKNTAKNFVGRDWDDKLFDDLMPHLTDELKPYVGEASASSKYKLAVAQGFMYKFYLKVYNQLFQKLDLWNLTEDEKLYLMSSSAEKECTHSGTRVYDVVTGQSEADTIGRALPHQWAKQSATGEAIYVDDMLPAQGEVYLTLVTSTKASAKILKVDPTQALSMPGVVSFLDHTSIIKTNLTGMLAPTEEIFATKEVHFYGQTIGAIVAESHDEARRAARCVIIEYEELEPIITIEDAIAKKSFHSMMGMDVLNFGDTTSAFDSCDHVIERKLKIGGQEHFYMETHSVRIVPTGEDGEVDVYVGAQSGNTMQKAVANALGVPFNKVFVHVKRMGGSFGGKEFRMINVTIPTAIAAARLNRPVRCMLERRQDMQITGIRRPYLAKYKVGFNKDGKVQALDLEMYSNDGYYPDFCALFMSKSILGSDNCYFIPNLSIRGHVCKTNLPPITAMRGAGVPQIIVICEHWMSNVADFLQQPAHKIRELNLYRGGDMTFTNVPIENSLRRCFDDVLKQSNYEKVLQEFDQFNGKSSILKRGIAVVPIKFSYGFPPFMIKGGALVNIYEDGSVLLFYGGTESGQGLHTKMIQIASRALDIPVDRIHISETCTSVVPNAVITAGSTGTDINGPAVLDACNILIERLKPFKEANPTGKWEDWITVAIFKKVNLSATGYFNQACHEDFDFKTGKGQASAYFTYGAAATQVEIDCLTGSYRILKTDIVMDIGKSLNPAIDVGQIEGAFVMGIGYYALEEHRYCPNGQLETVGAGKYHIPTVGSIPLEMNVSILKDTGNPKAIYSSKCIGEPPLLLSVSVFVAIKDTISATRRQAGLFSEFNFDSPATVQSIRLACGTEPVPLQTKKP